MTVSKKIEGFIVKSSWIRKMFEEGIARVEKYGAANVFDFSLGNPNLEPPDSLREIPIQQPFVEQEVLAFHLILHFKLPQHGCFIHSDAH